MSRYPLYRDSRQSFGINVLGTLVVEVEADDGSVGFGITTAGLIGCFIVEKHLSRFILGRVVDEIKLVHDQMIRSTLFYSGGGGVVMNAISCVDLAMWDLLGRVLQQPVHSLLGGAVRDEIVFYATGSRPDLAKDMGFIGGKLPAHFDPSDGDAGIRQEVEQVKNLRDIVGNDFWLMLDCWMSQDLNYSIKLSHAMDEYGLKWLEEPFPAAQYEDYAELRRRMPPGMMLSSGEHHGNLAAFRSLSDAGIDVLQPDVGWCGGVTSLLEIAALAKSRGQLVIPHGSSVYSHHAVITFTNSPFSEFLMTSPGADELRPQFDPILIDEPVPSGGRIGKEELNEPGFGVELNRNCPLERPFTHEKR